MKKIIAIYIILCLRSIMNAQENNENISFTYAEFKSGYGVSQFGEGLSEKYDAGNFSNSGGFLATLGAYHKFKPIHYLNFGIKYKSLGAFPSRGDDGEELFFNYWGAAFSVKGFPFDKNAKQGLYLQTDYYFITQFTQKYRKTKNLDFNHQFAKGTGICLGAGYDFPILKGKRTMLTIGVEYEFDSRTGEVTAIGFKTFKSSNIGILAGIKF